MHSYQSDAIRCFLFSLKEIFSSYLIEISIDICLTRLKITIGISMFFKIQIICLSKKQDFKHFVYLFVISHKAKKTI